MMTDRELLEFAAKAAGIEYEHRYRTPEGSVYKGLLLPLVYHTPPIFWNPLADDGDALRLAVKLRFGVYVCLGAIVVESEMDKSDATEPCGSDPFAATRRAIVRAAAQSA